MIVLPNFTDLWNFVLFQQVWGLGFFLSLTLTPTLGLTGGLGFSWRNSSYALIFCIHVHFGQTNIFRKFHEIRLIYKKNIDKCYHLRRRKTYTNIFFIYQQIYIKLVENDCLTKFYWFLKFHHIRTSLRVRVFFYP